MEWRRRDKEGMEEVRKWAWWGGRESWSSGRKRAGTGIIEGLHSLG